MNFINGNTALQTQISEEMLPALLDQEINSIMENIDFRPGRIGIMHREKKFVTPDAQTVNSISGVIVYFHKARGYWMEEGQKIPTCSSMDGKTGTWRLSEDETQPKSCATCPYNQYGSDTKGRQGKACKEMRRLFIVENDAILPAILNIPPTSLKAFDTYISGLIAKKKASIAYGTTFRLESANSGGFDYSKVVLEQGDKLPNDKLISLLKMREEVVAAAANIGIEADDYMGETATGGEQPLREDKEPY